MSANTSRGSLPTGPTTNLGDTSPLSDAQIFAHALLGKPLPSAEREHLEFAAAISTRCASDLIRGRRSQAPSAAAVSPPSDAQRFAEAVFGVPASDADHERELLEFVAAITGVHEAQFDSDKHPRGGYPQNRGWFSPAGSASGQAAGAAIAASPSDGPDSAPKRVHTTLAATPPVGHHYAAVGAVLSDEIRPLLSDDAVRYAMGSFSGRTMPDHLNGTYGGVTHFDYNAEVKKELREFIRLNKIDTTEKMTAAQMEKFVGLLKKGLGASGEQNPLISAFNGAVRGMVRTGTEVPTKMEEILAAGRSYMKHSRFQSLAAVAVISGVLGEAINQQINVLEVAGNSRHFQAALRALDDRDVARAHGQLTGDRDSLYTEIVEKVGAHAGLNFKTAVDRVFTSSRNRVYK